LRQQDANGDWHPVAYLSQTFNPAERNYKIYDRELLAIVQALEQWRHYLEGTGKQVQVLTDHKNLTYFRSPRKLNRRQARWQLFLSQFDLQLVHCPGRQLVQADTLTRKWPTHLSDDNVDEILLPNRLFASKPTICNRIASILLASIDTTVDPMPVVEEPTLLVDTTNGKLPKQATPNAAGLDLFANETLSIPAHSRSLVRLGIKVALPVGTYGQITPRSGLSVKGVDIGAEVIDSDYRGELQVVVINHASQPFHVHTGDRIAQLIVKKITFPKPVRTLDLDQTSRGASKFGSTGITGIDLGLRNVISRHMSGDSFGKSICRALENKSVSFPGQMVAEDWTADGKLLLFQKRCYIPANQLLCRRILQLYHDSPAAGHPGQQNTAALLERNYYWPGMRSFVSAYVRGCATCQQMKVNTHPTIPPLQPILAKLRDHPFQFVTYNFITALPQSDGYTALMVVVDHDSTKGAIFIPCIKKTDALETAELYYKHVFKRFGWPDKFLFDRGPQFDSLVLKELWRILGTEGRMTTAYHP
jgi:deoxyuridine 5'-triphosphate nucleotidohydrolase